MRNNQSPSIYSIYQNALPYYLDRVDACLLDELGEDFATKLVHSILKGSLQVQINATENSADKLKHLYFESRNYERTRGAKTFGFGYPFFIETYESELVIAPLFIWHLTLEPSQNRVNSWIIKFNQQNAVLPNYQLVRHIERRYDIEILDKYESFAMMGKLNYHAIRTLLDQLGGRIGFGNEMPDSRIVPCPGIDEIGTLSTKKNIFYAGVFSLFPSQSFEDRDTILKPEEVFVKNEQKEDASIFNYLPCDSHQASAIEKIYRNKVTIIEGESTSGKTQTLVNILTNALDNGQKCLVVSERVPSLKKAQILLASTGINQFNFLLDDAINDKSILLEILRVAAAGIGKNIEHSEEDYQIKKNQYLRTKQKLNKRYSAVKSNVFGDLNWTETVGKFIESNRIEGKELLNGQLNSNDFKFNYEEYESLKSGILASLPLYNKLKTPKHPLSVLNRNIFLEKKKADGLKFTTETLKLSLTHAAKLQHRYLNKIDRYGMGLREHYERHFVELEKHSSLLIDKIEAFSDKFGNEFKSSTGTGKGLFKISKRAKEYIQAKEFISVNYLNLVTTFEEKQYFDYQFFATKEGFHIPKVIENLDNFRIKLSNWRNQIHNLVQEEILRLNSKTAHPNLGYDEHILDLETSLDAFLTELNESGLFDKSLENKTLTIPQRQKYLDNTIEQLERTKLNLRDFDIFYDWQRNWLNLSQSNQLVINALIKVKPQNWVSAFESWYLQNILSLNESTELPTNDELIDDFVVNFYQFRPLILNKIGTFWQELQAKTLRELKRTNKGDFQLIFGKDNQQRAKGRHLNYILAKGLDAITATLPVMFVTPHVAARVFPFKEEYFDLVIFDEANRFSVETATPIARLGKRQVIFGSNDTYGHETSLIQYAKESNVPTVELKNRYDLPEITEEERIQRNGMHHLLNQFPQEFDIENVGGRFNEKMGINDVEAQHIIRLLNEVKRTPKRTYPSVGIVCFTVEQRDLISSYLLKIKQQNSDGADKIAQLERNGMGVFHIDELYGQHFDILIISLTVGNVNVKGALTKKIVFFNTPEGTSHLKLLIHKSPKKLYLIHSIPDTYLNKFLKSSKNEGTYLLANFIKSGEFAKKLDKKGLSKMAKVIGIRPENAVETSILAREIHHSLSPYFKEDRLERDVKVDNIIIPLVVKPIFENEPPIAVFPDGFFADSDFTSFFWEEKQRSLVQKLGYKYVPVWSVKWWKAPLQEARKLASLIIKQDSAFKPIVEKVKTTESIQVENTATSSTEEESPANNDE